MSPSENEKIYQKEVDEADALVCPLGEIQLFLDNQPVAFAICNKPALSDYAKENPVDANKRLLWKYVPDGESHTLDCRLVSSVDCDWDYACTEHLEAIEIFNESTTLIIGTQWDGLNYEYNRSYGIEDYSVMGTEGMLRFSFDELTKSHDIIIGVSWLSGYTEDSRVNPWNVGDPSIDQFC